MLNLYRYIAYALIVFTLTACGSAQPAEAATKAQSIQFLLSQVRASGVALSGGKVDFYEAGATTTRKTVWIDRNKATPAANPYTLDSNGTAALFGDGLYRIVIKDSAGVTKYDRDYISIKEVSGNVYDVADYASLAAAVASIGSTPATLQFASDVTVSANLVIPATLELMPLNGAKINHTTYTISYAGSTARWPDTQIFNGTGTVSLPNAAEAPILWWGGKGDNSTDCTTAFRAAVAALTSGNVIFKQGIHKITDTITISKKFIGIEGKSNGGRGVSKIRFVTTSGKTCILFDAVTAGLMYHNSVKNIDFTSERTDGDFPKVAIESKDADHLTIENVAIHYWYDSTGASEGIRTGGRQFIRCRNVTIYANKPLRISQNPYRAAVGNIDIDHSTFTNMFMVAGIPAAGEYAGEISGDVVTIDTGVTLTNVTFDGYQSWGGYGNHGLYWDDTTSTGASFGLSLNNVRIEGDTDAAKYMFYIKTNSGLQNLNLSNIYGGRVKKGLYLRYVDNANIRSWHYVNIGSNEAINVDSTVKGLSWANVFTQTGTTASIVGQDLIYGVPQETGALLRSAAYASTAEGTTQFKSNKALSGERVTVANDTTLTLCTNAFRGMIIVADSEGASSIFAINGPLNSTVEVSDPSGVYSAASGTVTSSNIYWNAGDSTYKLQNKRGASRNYFITRLGG